MTGSTYTYIQQFSLNSSLQQQIFVHAFFRYTGAMGLRLLEPR